MCIGIHPRNIGKYDSCIMEHIPRYDIEEQN